MSSPVAARSGSRIHINGVVQGVGFRPFIYGLANDFHLTGWVRNTSAGVDIEVDGPSQQLDDFIHAITDRAPPLARIDDVVVHKQPTIGFATFEIKHSEPIPGAFQPISADVSICADCLRELLDPHDRHYHYPFVNCTNCGPRFTIIKDVPYDRPETTMAPFAMCPQCAAEYHDPLDRRFHAQPVACPDCGPQIWLEINGGKRQSGPAALQAVREFLQAGMIVAIKGLGGFHLACDAANPNVVNQLRARKLRVDKPFAVMMPDLDAVRSHCYVSSTEAELLQSRERPIVVLHKRPSSLIVDAVAPNQTTVGVMLPYTPLHVLLIQAAPEFPQVLVMTSGNVSEEPILTTNAAARRRLSSLADIFLMHSRDIHTRCDDSVVRCLERSPTAARQTKSSPSAYFLRRARGYAPFPLNLPWQAPELLAAGGELKNTFCLTKQSYAFLSHHIGDLENYETLQAFHHAADHYQRLFRVQPQAVVHDLHPDYMATRFAVARAAEENIPAFGVQHHHAHLAACLADNAQRPEQPVMGVIFDGTGYGTDGAIWGGEFLVGDYAGYERPFHLDYIPLPGGDKAVRQPWRLALTWLRRAGLPWEEHYPSVSFVTPSTRQMLKRQIEIGLNAPQTSSMGRLFDAVAALCGVRQTINYEAQAAIELEAVASPHEDGAYPFDVHGEIIDPLPLIQAAAADLRRGLSSRIISARFHNGVSQMTLEVCRKLRSQLGLHEVALSGGVWQNMLLLEKTIRLLEADGFLVYTHVQVPANDGGLALGQAAIAASLLRNGKH